MNWRRGLLLATIHFVIAASLISWEELRYYRQEHGPRTGIAASLRTVAWQEVPVPEMQNIDPCNGVIVDHFTTPAERILQVTNLPVWSLIQWRIPCPSRWTLSRALRAKSHLGPQQEDFALALILCILVPIQWFLIGGIPLLRPRWWWSEPGAIITIYAAVAIALIPLTDPYGTIGFAAEFPMLVALLAWLWWLGLLIWKVLQSGWRIAAVWRAPHLG